VSGAGPTGADLADGPPADLVAVRDDFRALAGYHSAQVDVDVRLNTNESPYAPPAAWLDALGREVQSLDWNRYPDRGATALRERIAAWHGVDPAQVFAANGSNEVLQTVLLGYAGPGRRVVVFEPTYQMHAQIARVTGARVVAGQRDDRFRLDPAHAAAVIATAQPAVTFLCSPNNPTGIVEDPAVLDAVLASAPGLVVVDEAYAQFSTWSALDLVTDDRALVVTRTFSKTWSMAAVRLGYLIGPRWLVAQLDKVVLPYHLDAVKQLAGRLALDHVDDMERRVSAIVEERGRLAAGLADLGAEVFPSGANFVLFRLGERDAAAVWRRLVDRGVLIRDCSGWDRLAGCLRVTVGLPDENGRFLAALGAVLAEPGGGRR
jgi:histidinol-phosphate aminotransferase